MDWLDLLAVQGTHKSLFQHHSSKASILQRSAFFTVQISHPYMTTEEFLVWTIFSLYWICYSVASALVFWPRDILDLSSLIRDPTCTPCIGRWSPNHWSTREVPITNFYKVENEKGCDCWKKQLGLIHQPKERSIPLYSVYTPDWKMQSKRLSPSFLGLIINKLHNEGLYWAEE